MAFKTTVEQDHGVCADVPTLAGLTIPNPSQNQGAIVYVISVDNWFGLSLTSNAPIDGISVIGTVLGGPTRWLKLSIEPGDGVTGPTGPAGASGVTGVTGATGPASAIFAFARVDNNGNFISGVNINLVVRNSLGDYSLFYAVSPADATKITIVASSRQGLIGLPQPSAGGLAGFGIIGKTDSGALTDLFFDVVCLQAP